jgi:hypothetical protein
MIVYIGYNPWWVLGSNVYISCLYLSFTKLVKGKKDTKDISSNRESRRFSCWFVIGD